MNGLEGRTDDELRKLNHHKWREYQDWKARYGAEMRRRIDRGSTSFVTSAQLIAEHREPGYVD